MDFGTILVISLIYVLIGRWLVNTPFRGRYVAFAFLNVLVIYILWFADARSWFAIYFLFIALQYTFLSVWSGKTGWQWWFAFLLPIAILATVRYTPFEMLAHVSAALAQKLKEFPNYHKDIDTRFVGLSYVAFRSSYLLIEIRNGVVKKPNLWEYLGFVFFAPTLAVGPINSYNRYQLAFSADHRPIIPIGTSVVRVLVGAVKFRFLGPILNQLTYTGLLRDGNSHPWVDFPIAVIAYYLFLYCNFSGFCDIAIGGAGIVGISVAENFDSPFAARNVKVFWNRWHITLSSYMRDVVFAPLSKVLTRAFGPSNANHAVAATIVVVFLLIGVWHGVGWNYAAFGAAHALGLTVNHYYTIRLKKWLGRDGFNAYNGNRWIRAAAVGMTFCYCAAALFLFANTFPQMRQIFAAMK